jgi:hypothetical protein
MSGVKAHIQALQNLQKAVWLSEAKVMSCNSKITVGHCSSITVVEKQQKTQNKTLKKLPRSQMNTGSASAATECVYRTVAPRDSSARAVAVRIARATDNIAD